MATSASDATVSLEKLRLQLEANVDKLRKALQHWQTWEAEYEVLKEEIESLPKSISPNDLAKAALSASGKLVNEKETSEILGLQKGTPRDAKQIIGILDRRIDYVNKNVTSVQKQFDDAELRLYNLDAIQQETRNEEGLPLAEINEELDEDGNVISGAISHPGESSGHLMETLQKIGINEKDLKENDEESESEQVDTVMVDAPSNKTTDTTQAEDRTEAFTSTTSPKPQMSQQQEVSPSRKRKAKTVSFAAEVDNSAGSISTANHPSDSKPSSQLKGAIQTPKQAAVPCITNLAEGSFPSHSRVIEVDENDIPIAINAPADPIKNPIIPPDESEEDARLRREMLQYSMSEVGAVVAQMDLEERGSDESDFSDENYDIDEEDADEYDYGSGISTEDEEDEDEHGLSRRSRITAGYKQKMEELEKKLNAQMLENLGPRPPAELLKGDGQEDGDARLADDARTLRILSDEKDARSSATQESLDDTELSEKMEKKGVRFADSLGVSSSDQTGTEPPASIPKPAPFKDIIQERDSSRAAASNSAVPAEPRKQSRFKAARTGSATATGPDSGSNAATAPPDQSLPNAQPLADRVVERQTPVGSATAKPPSASDPHLLNQQLGMEYVRQRNNMIYRQGGFLRDDDNQEQEEAEVDAEEDSRPAKKMSRFMAARVRGP